MLCICLLERTFIYKYIIILILGSLWKDWHLVGLTLHPLRRILCLDLVKILLCIFHPVLWVEPHLNLLINQQSRLLKTHSITEYPGFTTSYDRHPSSVRIGWELPTYLTILYFAHLPFSQIQSHTLVIIQLLILSFTVQNPTSLLWKASTFKIH